MPSRPHEPSRTPTLAEIPVGRLETVDSTSLEARRRIESAAPSLTAPFLVVARVQTAGRGRGAKRWASPPGGLWMTLAWPAPLSPPGVTDALGLRVGLALVRAAESQAGGTPIELKWPNDALAGGKKVAGALTEIIAARGERWILVGCGVNADLSRADLPPDLRDAATTLRELAGAAPDLAALRERLTRELAAALSAEGAPPELLAEARGRLFGIGLTRTVTAPDGASVDAELVGLDDRGRALFRDAAGRAFPAEPD